MQQAGWEARGFWFNRFRIRYLEEDRGMNCHND